MGLDLDLQPIIVWLSTTGVRILIIILASLLGYYLLRVISRQLERLVAVEEYATANEREQRVETLTTILRGTGLVLIVAVAGVMILSELGLNIGPLIAGAGIAGLAIGFGAQALVKDIISGFFILLENQFTIGDVISVGGISGGVEKMSLRATFLRDLEGTLHVIPNGEIRILSNKTKGWARAVINVGIAYKEDVARVLAILDKIGQEMWQDEGYRPFLLEEPAVSGVEELGDSAMTLRITVKTQAGKQWEVSRELRKRIKETFEEEGIEMPYPTQVHITRVAFETPPPRRDEGNE
ncbi:MAG TPA: mechanosensitive ion channel family protein [Chloroflexi bacterium]|nr:mechanosensitive ion channel family protein [Chloroflexota bacterium]